MVQPYNSTNTGRDWKNSGFILSDRADFDIIFKPVMSSLCFINIIKNTFDNMTMRVMPIVIGVLGKNSEESGKEMEELEIRGRSETI